MTTNIPVLGSKGSKFSKERMVPGEKVLWEGRPSVLGYFLRSLLLFILGVLFGVFAIIQDGQTIDFGDFGSYLFLLLMILLAVIMYGVERRWGLAQGILAGVIIVVVALDVDISWIWYFAPLLVGLVEVVIDWVVWSHTYFAITDRRIMTQTGIFSLMFADTQIDRVQNVTVVQPFFERVLGYGDIMFATAGEMGGIKSDKLAAGMKTGGAIVWEDVARPFEVRKIAESIIYHATNPAAQYIPQPVAPAPTHPAEAEERLTKLKEMKDKGLISSEEYEQKRREIIGQL
jgi:membrane protein YdbS with pleckstrin-like domain